MPALSDLFRLNNKTLTYNDVVDRNRVLRNPDGTYRISQIRGHSNSPPKSEYDQMIEDFRRSFEQ